jgi:hypothetical protein
MTLRLLLSAFVCLSLAGCGGGTSKPQPEADAAADATVDSTADTQVAEEVLPDDVPPDLCVPICESIGAECGSDGCGGSCGECPEGEVCSEAGCIPEEGCELLEECYPWVCGEETGQCGPCTADEQCAPAGDVCDETSGFCTLCVDDEDCGPGFGCEESQCVELGCPAVPCDEGLLCNEASGECVECLGDGDCPPNHSCADFACQEPAPCESSKDCELDEVCDKDKGICVECVTDDDCPENHRCIETQICELILVCESDKECKEYDKVCNLEIGECVDCLSDLDCADTSFCQASVCLPDLCDQAAEWPACVDGNVAQCNENGSLLTTVQECPEKTFCVDAACQDWLCEPDSVGCSGSVAYLCNEQGSGYLSETDCAENEEACSGGECKPVVCEPGQTVCLDPLTLVTCGEEGTDFVPEPCGDGFYCDAEATACVPWVCVPGSKDCDGQTALTCDEFGSSWGDPVVCDEDGFVCVNGECVECDPACGDKECGPDACGGVCGICGETDECFSGYCLLHQCPTPCTGKSPPALQCGLDLCYPDLNLGASVSAPLGDDINVMWDVLAQVGTPGNSLGPKAGESLVALATGNLSAPQHNSEVPPNQCGADPHGQAGQACDVATATVSLKAPPGATGFSLDWIFLSMEFGLQQSFEDRFYIFLTAPQTTGGQAWVINFVPCNAQNGGFGFTHEGQNFCYIGAKTGINESPAVTNIAGSGFTGSTGWWRTSWQIAAGEEFTLHFRIQDAQDSKYDSAVLVDHFQWLFAPVTPKSEKL